MKIIKYYNISDLYEVYEYTDQKFDDAPKWIFDLLENRSKDASLILRDGRMELHYNPNFKWVNTASTSNWSINHLNKGDYIVKRDSIDPVPHTYYTVVTRDDFESLYKKVILGGVSD